MAPDPGTRHGRAFGVEVDAAFAMPRLPLAALDGSLPRVRVEEAGADELRRAWPSDGDEALRRSFPDGRLVMLVERHPEAGYSVWAPRYGRYLVSPDGTLVRSAVPRVPAWRWERLLFAQVLPLASALTGRELFHASAVSVLGRVVAFVGASGAGKSSVAAHLVDRGATLVTDDVLALELARTGVVAHPGTRLVGLDPKELAMTTSAAFDTRLGKAEKTYVDVAVATTPAPLAGVYFLTAGDGSSVEVTRSSETAAHLLGASFLAYLDEPEHLVRHLDVCAAIAGSVPTFDVHAPRAAGAVRVAAAVEAHVRIAICGLL